MKYKIHVDRFFATPNLVQKLANKKIGFTSTINTNRKQFPKQLVQSKFERGEWEFRMNNNTIILKWKDSKDVYFASNCIDPTVKAFVSRTSKTEQKYNLDSSLLTCEYQAGMRGTDLMDQFLSEYMFDHKCYRWWFRPYIYFFYVSVFNSFKYYSLSNQNQNVSLKNYIVELSKSLCGDKITKKRGAPFKSTNRKKYFI